jgi:hypothetical protein
MTRIALAIVAALVALTGCIGGQLDPKAQRAADTFACYVATLAPYVGEVTDVVDLVEDAVRGKADPLQSLRMLGATAGEVTEVAHALDACRPPPPIPLEPEPAELQP